MAKQTQRSQAHGDAKSALAVVDSVLSYMSDSRGKPARKERALYAAAIVFAYGVWENFVEQLAIELAGDIAQKIAPDKVPEIVRTSLQKCTAWELNVSPGWRQLWIQKVTRQAIGDDGENYGLNTAKAGQVQDLLRWAGAEGIFGDLDQDIVPAHIANQVSSPSEALNRLVELRGEIVHTGAVPDELRKQHVREWRQFVERLADELDESCRDHREKLLK